MFLMKVRNIDSTNRQLFGIAILFANAILAFHDNLISLKEVKSMFLSLWQSSSCY